MTSPWSTPRPERCRLRSAGERWTPLRRGIHFPSSRWSTSMRPEVALRGVRNNLPTLDIRSSHYNYLALHNGMTTLNRLGFLPGVFDVNKVFYPGPILDVMRKSPNLFSDLPPVPRAAMVG